MKSINKTLALIALASSSAAFAATGFKVKHLIAHIYLKELYYEKH